MMMATRDAFLFAQLSPSGSAHTEQDDAQAYMRPDAWQIPLVSPDEVRTIMMLYDDEEVRNIFGRSAGPDRLLSTENLEKALAGLGVSVESGAGGDLDLEDFKRVARSPSEAEQFFQMIPLAGLLARSLRKSDLAGLEGLTDEEVLTGLQAFNESVRRVVGERLRKLKGQLANLRAVDHGNSKFGGQLEGGTVDDFHHVLADRLGEFLG